MELLVARCAGLDVAKDELVACVRVPDGRGGRDQQVRTFQTFTLGLEALADWLAAEEVTQVVLEVPGHRSRSGQPGGHPRSRAARDPRSTAAHPGRTAAPHVRV